VTEDFSNMARRLSRLNELLSKAIQEVDKYEEIIADNVADLPAYLHFAVENILGVLTVGSPINMKYLLTEGQAIEVHKMFAQIDIRYAGQMPITCQLGMCTPSTDAAMRILTARTIDWDTYQEEAAVLLEGRNAFGARPAHTTWLIHAGMSTAVQSCDIPHGTMVAYAASARNQMVNIMEIIAEHEWPPECTEVVLRLMGAMDDSALGTYSNPLDDRIEGQKDGTGDGPGVSADELDRWFNLG